MRSKVFITQALSALMRGPAQSRHALPHSFVKSAGTLALSLTLLTGLTSGFAFAASKNVQISGVHYQPEGVVIQTLGGKSKAPSIETWPNQKDGQTTELVMIRIPNCDGDYAAMQQAALQEMTSHPEIKQFWVTPISNEKAVGKGLQIALEVVTSSSKPEFTPETLAQGDDQWVVTLQSVASKLSNRPIAPASEQAATQQEGQQVSNNTPEPASDDAGSSTGRHRNKKAARKETEPATATQSMLIALNEAKQKQAELGAQLVTLQQQLAESNAQKDALQARLNGYENLLEETGVDPLDAQKEDKLIIQNLKNALVRVAQKLKTAEDALAKENSKPTSKPSQPAQPVRNLVKDTDEDNSIPPVATLGMAEAPAQKKNVSAASTGKASTTNVTKTANTNGATSKLPSLDTEKIASATGSSNVITNVYKAGGSATPTLTNTTTPSAKTATTKKDETEARLQKAIQKNPIQVDNYLSLADYYVAKKDWKNAQSTLVNLTHVAPGGAQGYYYLAMIYLSMKDRKNAQTAMEQYVKRNPKDTKGIQTLKKAMQANSSTGTNTVNAVKTSKDQKTPVPISAKAPTGKIR